MAVNTEKTYTTKYSDLRGVDLSSGKENVHQRRTPSGINMISDEGGNPMKRRGWERVNSTYKVLQMWSFTYHNQEHLMCHVYDKVEDKYCRKSKEHRC